MPYICTVAITKLMYKAVIKSEAGHMNNIHSSVENPYFGIDHNALC